MIVATKTNLEREVWKDLFIVALALALTALLASIAHGQAAPTKEPPRIAPEIILLARPLPAEAAWESARLQDITRSGTPLDPAPFLGAGETPERVWNAIRAADRT